MTEAEAAAQGALRQVVEELEDEKDGSDEGWT